MKKSIAILAFCSLSFFVLSQQVQRDKVVVEIGTGTWCPYCPGAAMGADDLVSNGHDVAVIEYHSGDEYQNSYALARISYYNITGFPTAVFDGLLQVVGGSSTVSMYPQYLAKYNQRIVIPSSFTIDIEGTHSGLVDYDLTVTVEKVAATTATNLVLHLVLTESHIPKFWQGMDELNFVERRMFPNQSGTSLDFTSSNVQQVDVTFSLQSGWVAEHCEIVAFVQNLANKEVLQGTRTDLMDFGTSNNYDASVGDIRYVPYMICDGIFTPRATISNFGAENLTSLELEYVVNGAGPVTYTWNGNLPYLESEEVTLPEVTMTIQSTNLITVTAGNPNGQPDQYPQNNSTEFSFAEAPEVTAPVYFIMKLDGNPGETTWELKDSGGNVLYSGGPYTQPNGNVIEQLELSQPDCYRFVIHDAGGNGLEGAGIFKLADAGQQVFAQGNDFGSVMEVQFNTMMTGFVLSGEVESQVSVTPNPFENSAVVTIQPSAGRMAEVRLFDGQGRMIIQASNLPVTCGQARYEIPGDGLTPGIYYLKVYSGDDIHSCKLVKQ
ncbi:MAG: Omp28-related outer membrane protein [Bacteroidales bacterium]|nr:Omp28-related outer membrane protein [Bacteroidales bacterium]